MGMQTTPFTAMAIQAEVVTAVLVERDRQDRKWGRAVDQTSSHDRRLTIMTEEVGEVAEALIEDDLAHAEEEYIHVAAVAIANAEIIRWRRATQNADSVFG